MKILRENKMFCATKETLENSKMLTQRDTLNKFNIGDTVHVSVIVVGVRLTDSGVVTYTVDCKDADAISTNRMRDVPESFISKVF